jgi:hypothetical protein
MGTAAVLAFASNEGTHYTQILGMTHDGFPNNLEYFASRANTLAVQLDCLEAFKRREWSAIRSVMDALVVDSKSWLFVDAIDNAQWVSYSAIYDPATGKLKLYDGLLEGLTNIKNLGA